MIVLDEDFNQRQKKIAELVPEISPEIQFNLRELGICEISDLRKNVENTLSKINESQYLSRYSDLYKKVLQSLEVDYQILSRQYETLFKDYPEILTNYDNEYKRAMYLLFGRYAKRIEEVSSKINQ